ncbi:hypothetical protein MASR2M15_16070 [Anaerolineales bacterium]
MQGIRSDPQSSHSTEKAKSSQISRDPQSLNEPLLMQMQRVQGNAYINRMLDASNSPRIQRLNTSESYYYNTIAHVAEYEPAKANIKQTPEWRGFLSKLSIYAMFLNQGFNRAKIGEMKGHLKPVIEKAFDLRAYLSTNYPRDHDLQNMGFTATDDLQQETVSLDFLAGDLTLMDGALTWQQALFYARAGVSPSAALGMGDLAPGTGTNEVGNPKTLGGGQVSEVIALDFATPTGGVEKKVFKPNEVNPSESLSFDKFNTQTAYRALAVSRVESLIAANLRAANKTYDSMMGDVQLAMYKGKQGTTAGFAAGSSEAMKSEMQNGRIVSQSYLNVDFNDISLQRQLANLQLFDMIVGQIDRHMGNVMVKQDGNSTKVTGIDNDFAFGTNRDTGSQGKTVMPTLIDKYFAMAIVGIHTDDFVEALKGLRSDEIASAVARLTDIQAQIQSKINDNLLITLPGDTTKGTGRDWSEVDSSEYSKYDYMGQMQQNYQDAFKAVKKNPSLAPSQKDGKWVLDFDGGDLFMMSRTGDGSDLWDLVNAARAEAQQEAEEKRVRDLRRARRFNPQGGPPPRPGNNPPPQPQKWVRGEV